MCFKSKNESKNLKEDLEDEYLINVILEELGRFERNKVLELVPRLNSANIFGTKWIYKNKSCDNRSVTRNKARQVDQGYTLIKGVDFDETFTPFARLEAIRLLLGVSCLMKLKL